MGRFVPRGYGDEGRSQVNSEKRRGKFFINNQKKLQWLDLYVEVVYVLIPLLEEKRIKNVNVRIHVVQMMSLRKQPSRM